ncbi:MAG: peptidylprolyl isomerase [Betaproteobacteria bacterium]|jgi:FKBP-type peptidyl-prolyl cis-trans isomerase SlpA
MGWLMAVVESGSHVTLHYRLAVVPGDGSADERDVVSTFGGHAATLQVGAGQLAAPLEQRLLGLAEGAQAQFDLAPGEAYGERNPALVQTLSRAVFDANAEPGESYAPGDIVQFRAPDGQGFSGVLKMHGDSQVVVDFNHPLAGLPLRFAVRVIGVL